MYSTDTTSFLLEVRQPLHHTIYFAIILHYSSCAGTKPAPGVTLPVGDNRITSLQFSIIAVSTLIRDFCNGLNLLLHKPQNWA